MNQSLKFSTSVEIIVRTAVIVLIAVGAFYAYQRVSTFVTELETAGEELSTSIDLMVEEDQPADALANRLEHPNPLARAAAIRGLAKLNDRRAVAPLVRELEALGRTWDSAKLDPEKSWLRNYTNNARYGAQWLALVDAIEALPDPSYLPALEALRARTMDIEHLLDVIAKVRRASTPDSGAARAGVDTLLDDAAILDDIPRLRTAVDASSAEGLLRGLQSAVTLERYDAETVLARECLRRPELDFVAAAARWAKSDKPIQRRVSAKVLGRASEEMPAPAEVLAILLPLASDRDVEVAHHAHAAIAARTQSDAAVLRSLGSAEHADARVRGIFLDYVLNAEAWPKSNEDLDWLVRFLRDPAAEVRDRAYDSLLGVLTEDDPSRALIIKHAGVRDAVLKSAADEMQIAVHRVRAMRVLAHLRDAAVVPLIAHALAGADPTDSPLLFELIEVAQLMPHPSYVAGLERLRQGGAADFGKRYDGFIAKLKRAREP